MVASTQEARGAVRVAVTGAASKGGAVISRLLESSGHTVRAGVHARPRSGRASVAHDDRARERCPAAECLPIDMLRPATLDPFFEGVDAAVLILPRERWIVPMAADLVAAAGHAGVERLVLISFLRVDSSVAGAMPRWQYDMEQAARRSGIAVTCLRPNFYMQNFLSAFRPSPGLNGGLISYVDARDVAEVVLTVLSDPRRQRDTYSLTGPRAYSVEDVMRVLEGEVGPAVSLPSTGWDQVCSTTRRSAHSVEIQALCEMWQAAAEGCFATVTSDVERVLGRPPRTLEDFARDHHGQCRRIVSVQGASRQCA